MENTSPFVAMQRLETQLKTLIRQLDMDTLEPKERQAIIKVRRLGADARLDIRDYELSETREEQLTNAADARKRLKGIEDNLQNAGFVFGPADMAQISAQLAQINGWLV